MRLYDIAADFRRLSDLLEDESTPEEMRQTIIETSECTGTSVSIVEVE